MYILCVYIWYNIYYTREYHLCAILFQSNFSFIKFTEAIALGLQPLLYSYYFFPFIIEAKYVEVPYSAQVQLNYRILI